MADLGWIVYARVSTDEQVAGTSLQAQIDAGEALARLQGRTVLDVITDPGQSAKDLRRPGIQRALELIRTRQAAGLIVYRLDRLTRRLRDLLDLVDLAAQHGAGLVSVSEQLDTSTPIGRFFVSLLGAVAQWERETIVDRVIGGIRRRQAEGRYTGGPPPAGLIVVDDGDGKRLARCPDRGDLIAGLWPAVAAGTSLRQIVADLRQAWPERSWSLSSVARLLASRRAIGLLVEAETWESAQAALSARRGGLGGRRAGSSASARIWPLAGLAVCGRCGAALVTSQATGRGGRRYPYYRCGGRMRGSGCQAADLPAAEAEALVIDALAQALDPQAEHLARLKAQIDQAGQQQATAQARLAEARRARDLAAEQQARLLDLVAQGGLAGQAAARRIADLEAQQAEAGRQIAQIEAEAAAAGIRSHDLDGIAQRLRWGLAGLAQASLEQQQAALAGLVGQVAIDRDAGTVSLALNEQALGIQGLARVRRVVPHGTAPGTVCEPVRVQVAWARGADGRWCGRVVA